jgi:hypothetical protein
MMPPKRNHLPMKPPVTGRPPRESMKIVIMRARPGAFCPSPERSSTSSPMTPRRRRAMMMPNAPTFMNV